MSAALILLAAATAASPVTEVVPAAPAPADVQRGDDIIVTGARTEGTDDYSTGAQTTATRLPLSLRDTPQSVSVVTRAQIDDFQLNDINSLLSTVPGVTVQAQETDRIYYSARGFDIQTFQVDGIGLPFAFGIQTGSVDTAIYDHIEVVRGAPGLLSPTGNPSAVINFIRKRPTRELAGSAGAQYGSFDALRLEGDLSVPLTANGNVRARAVGALVDADSYLDRYRLRRWTGYGIVEADLGPNTVVSGGYAHQNHRSRGAMWGALPLYYTDGTRIDLPRSANTGPDWAGWDVTERQIFADLTHRTANGWTIKASALRRASNEDDALFYVYGNPVRGTTNGIDTRGTATTDDDIGVRSYPGAFRSDTKNLTLDLSASGQVTLFGRAHDLMFGLNRGAQRYRQYSSYDFSVVGQVLPLPQVFDGSFARPNFPAFDLSLDTHTRRETVFGLLRLNLADPLKLMLGGNITHATSDGTSYGSPQNFDRTRALPFVGATLALNDTFSAYASYTTIFNPQSEFDADNRLLDPIEGDNVEAGIKGAWAGGLLNASAAIFQARQRNTAEAAGFDTALGRTIYQGVDATSQGIELEFGGQLATGLNATGGYTLMRVRRDDDSPARTFVPRNTARLNVSWSPVGLERLTLGASAQYQSRIYLEPGALSSTTGQPIRLTQGGYALLDLLAGFDLTERVSVSANIRNVTNAKYLTALNFDQGYYGAPRTVLGTIRFTY